MTDSMTTFLTGVRRTSPLVLGVAPFGLICGAVCVGAGMPEWAAMGMSTIIFAGASQLVATQLMAEHASVVVVILTGLIINMRMFMYSASLAPYFEGVHPVKKGILAYMLTDQAYAISIARYGESGAEQINKPVYYFGSALTMWICFNSSTVLGAYLGAFIPPDWNLDFAIPLTFIAVVVPAVRDRPTLFAAAAAGVTACFANPLPYNLGMMVAAVAGILAGYCMERRQANG